jgi:hypothetical protein
MSDNLRAEVAARAGHHCEYCLIHERDTGFPHHIDHIISRKHGGTSTAENLALACVICNRYKGTDVASVSLDSGQIVRLFHPRRDRWSDHFQLSGGTIEPLTEIGRVTVKVLRLNSPERIVERGLLQLLNSYPKQ